MRKISKKIIALAILCAPVALVATLSQNVSAETMGEIMIYEGRAFYNDDPSAEVVEEGFEYDPVGKTLTLNNYHSKTIFIYEDLELILKGTNTFEAEGDGFNGLWIGSKVTVSGDGVLGKENSTGNTLGVVYDGEHMGQLIMKSGKIITRCAESSYVDMEGGELVIDGNEYGGVEDSLCAILFLNINGGSIKSNRGIGGYAFTQTGGNLEIAAPNPTGDMYHDYEISGAAFSYMYTTFNGGTANINGGGAGGINVYYAPDAGMKESVQTMIDENKLSGIILPENGAFEFNDGDVTIETKGIYGSIFVMSDGGSSLDGAVVISDDLTVEPDGANYTVASIDTGYGVSLYGFMNNGEGETTMDFDKDTGVLTITNVAKNLHIFSKKIEAPKTGSYNSEIDATFNSLLVASIIGVGVAFVTYKTLRKAE